MKVAAGWLSVFVVALVFAVLVDTGRTHLFIPDYIWLSVNLTVFLYLLARFVGRPMAQFLNTRREGIAEELQHARKQLEEAEEMRADVSRRLAEVENEVQALEERAQTDGENEANRISAQAQEEEERFIQRVEDEITRREAETRARLAQETADLTAQLARDLLNREMTDEDRQRVLDRRLDAMTSLEGKE
jgi:F-type H+-transporting ATPase subunit b